MTVTAPTVAPVLSTPDDHVFKTEATEAPASTISHSHLTEDEFREMYEINHTISEILKSGYKRVALQFPDELLGDSERVYTLLRRGVNYADPLILTPPSEESQGEKTDGNSCACRTNSASCCSPTNKPPLASAPPTGCRFFILADTSYSACCVDEVAAEHVHADVLVHYGRSCLSPTTRLPVIYIFTTNYLSLSLTIAAFQRTYPDKSTKVLVMADVTYSSHIPALYDTLQSEGYTNLHATEILHSPSSPLPNRSLPEDCTEKELRTYSLFHISPPLPSLILVLSTRLLSLHYLDPSTYEVTQTTTTSSPLLRRRYALLSHARSAGIIGVLVNTLNISQYLPAISHLKRQIREAGRKSYLVVVGKVNVEKVANFSEVEVWVGLGCWEQGVVGGVEGRGWYRSVITPWELGIALGAREWTGVWLADFAEVLRIDGEEELSSQKLKEEEEEEEEEEEGSDEDAPPEFDLRTGRYISTPRPLGRKKKSAAVEQNGESSAVVLTGMKKELIATGGVLSPAATFLKEKRTWQGLGSDLADRDGQGALVEEGRSGVARGYTVGEDGARR
jgi:diphthamide biosynthesis protein 2